MSDRKILIIGGAGYIGSHVCLKFMESGCRTVVLDDFSAGCRENLLPETQCIAGSFLDRKTLSAALEGVSAVVHLAALKSAGHSMTEPEKYAEHNIKGMIDLLNIMCEKGVKNIVFSSSAAVYGKPEYLPVDEGHPTKPINFYGYTKLASEELLQWYSQLKGIRFVALRYFNAVGYDPKGRVKGLEEKPNNLFPIIMETLFGIRNELLVFGDDYPTEDGTCIRDYIHVSDLAEAHFGALEHLQDGGDNLRLNLGTQKGFSVRQVVDCCRRTFQSNFPVRVSERRQGDPAELLANSDLAFKKIGWKAKITDLETILRTTHSVYSLHYPS